MKPKIEAHELYRLLNCMPKGALHHLHTTAAPCVEEYIKLTYDPAVAFNEREGMFKVLLGKEKLDGYLKCVDVRNFYKEPSEYDELLRKAILLTFEQTNNKESHDIWKQFQPKFARVGDLCKYVKFFKILLKSTLEACAKQNVFVVELRHTTGCLFNENREVIDIYDEIEIMEKVAEEIKAEYPYFRLMLILTCYKIVGPKHAKQILGHIQKANAKYPHLIAGFDMVNEEEYTP